MSAETEAFSVTAEAATACESKQELPKKKAGSASFREKASYVYDYRGLCGEKKTPAGSEYREYTADGKLLYTEKGEDRTDYIYKSNTVFAEIRREREGEAVYYHHTDHLGTTKAISDGEGKVVWEAETEAFGSVLSENGTKGFTASFTGKLYDEDAGMYYFNARWYDSELGRFVTQDPARDGSNWYAYCNNSPLNRVDSNGLSDTVIISPGHGMDRKGEKNPGYIDKKTGLKEVNVIYDFCKKLYADLDTAGVSYVNLKQKIEDTTKDHTIKGKNEVANKIDAEIDASLELCVHADANTKGYTGITLYYIDGKEKSKSIADYFSKKLNEAGLPTRVKPDTSTGVGSLGELRNTTAPAMLIEIGSMDTKESRNIMYEREDLLSKTLADSIKTFNKDRPNWK